MDAAGESFLEFIGGIDGIVGRNLQHGPRYRYSSVLDFRYEDCSIVSRDRQAPHTRKKCHCDGKNTNSPPFHPRRQTVLAGGDRDETLHDPGVAAGRTA